MPLPSGTTPLVQVASPPPPAFLVRFPEDTWTKLGAAARAGDQVSFTVGDDGLTLNIEGHEPIPLDNLPGQASELYESTNGSLVTVGVATSRLSVPFSAATTSRAAEKVRQTNELLDRERLARAGRVTGKPTPAPPPPVAASVKPLSAGASSLSNKPMSSGPSYPAVHAIAKAQPMARAMSGPAATLTMATTERIPLKTRIVQLLALGPLSLADILARTGGNHIDVERAAKVIGQQQPGGTFRLRPPQYAKIKIGQWKYTYDEKVTVIKLARKAFDELALPADSEERAELEQKAREALEQPSHGGGSSSGSNPTTPPEEQPAAAPPPKVKSSSPVKASSPLPPTERNESPAPSTSAPKKSAAAAKADKDRTKVGKQIAKMRSDFAKRASSLPNTKSADGTGSPRIPLGADGNDSDVPERRLDRSPEKKQKEKEPKEKTKPEKEREKETKTAKATKSSEPSKPEKEKEREKEKPRSIADKDKDANGKRKRDTGNGESSSKQRGAAARDYTSSESSDSEDDRGRGRPRKVKATTDGKAASKANGTSSSNGNGSASKRRGSPVYTSSEDEAPLKRRRDDKERDRPRKSDRERGRGERDKERDRERERDKDRDKERLRDKDRDKTTDDAAASSLPSFKRKQPAPLELNGHKRTPSGVSASAPLSPASPAPTTTPKYLPKGAPDAKALRRRWDEIYPRYQKLAESLSGVYQAAERVRDGGSPDSEDVGMSADDVSAKAAQWAEWHKELEGIKQWFAA